MAKDLGPCQKCGRIASDYYQCACGLLCSDCSPCDTGLHAMNNDIKCPACKSGVARRLQPWRSNFF